jgi:hypothetical protein
MGRRTITDLEMEAGESAVERMLGPGVYTSLLVQQFLQSGLYGLKMSSRNL